MALLGRPHSTISTPFSCSERRISISACAAEISIYGTPRMDSSSVSQVPTRSVSCSMVSMLAKIDLSSTQAHLADAGVVFTLPDKIGEYTFSYGSDVDTTARNGVGETEKIAEVDATYTKDGAELNLSAHKSYTVFSEDEKKNPVPATTAEVNGVTLTYRDAHYRFVPDDYEKSDEEKQQEKNGELVISYYGSDEVEDKMFQSVLWEQDGVTYLISGYDTGLDAQTMFDMAAELVK